jgi:hypothetical protein
MIIDKKQLETTLIDLKFNYKRILTDLNEYSFKFSETEIDSKKKEIRILEQKINIIEKTIYNYETKPNKSIRKVTI